MSVIPIIDLYYLAYLKCHSGKLSMDENFGSHDVEHIVTTKYLKSKNLTETRSHIGNLCLLTSDINRSMYRINI